MSLSSLFQKIETAAKHVLSDLFHAEVKALQPIAATLVAQAETDIVTAAATGSTSTLGATLGKLVADVGVQAEKASIQAGAASILGAASLALAANPTTAVASTAPALN